MCMVRLIVVMFVFPLCSGYISPLSLLLCYNIMFEVMCVAMWYFTDEILDLNANRKYFCNLEQDLN